jgi:putative thioredoxin
MPEPTVIDVTDADFEQRVLEESKTRPVVVDFWAGWCRPCLVLGPVIEKVVAEQSGDVLLAKVDVDANPVVASQFRVQSIPNVWAFKDGKPVDQFIGSLPEPAVRDWIAKLLPGEADAAADRAGEAEREGRLDDAETAYREALEEGAQNREARLGLARVLVASGQTDEARNVLQPILPDPDADRVLAAIRVSEWRSGVEDGALGAGKAAAAAGRFEEALEQFLALVKEEPGAREAMLDVFSVLGDDDPITKRFRPKLASALY